MRTRTIFLDSFSGGASDLPRGKRADVDILRALLRDSRVSTFDMSEHRWLSSGIQSLKNDGLLSEDRTEAYPWHRYMVTDAGLSLLATNETPNPTAKRAATRKG